MRDLPGLCRGRLPKREFIVRKDNTSCADCQIYLAVVAVRSIFRGKRRPYGIPPPRPLLLSCCPPPPCPVSSARRVSASSAMSVPFGTPLLSRPIAAIGLPAALPCIVSRPGLLPDIRPLRPSFPGIHPTHDRLLFSASALPRYSLSWHPPSSPPPFLVPSRPFSSLLVPSRPFFSPSRPLLCIPCFRPRPCRSFFREAGDFGMKMRNTSLFGK